MAGRTIEAKLIISGEDRASGEIAKVVKTIKSMEDAAKVSKQMESVAKVLRDIEQASRVTDAALKARSGYAAAEAGLKATQGAAKAAAQALNDAKVAKAAFDGVKAVKGSDQARQIEVVTKAYRDAGAAYRKVEGDMRRASAATAAQASTMKAAETAAARYGADLGSLESHQVRLRSATESATNAVRTQIRVEDQAARAATHHARERAEAARHVRQHGAIGAAAAAVSGGVGIHSVIHQSQHALKAGAEVQSNRVDMAKAGIGFDERQHITDESLELATKYRNVTQAGAMELWKELRSVMTDPHEVDHVIDPMVRAKSLLDAHDKTGTASHGLNLLVKGAENIGAAKDPARFVTLLDGYIRAMQVMGKTITPEGIYEMQKYSKAAGSSWSDRFIMTTSASLGQEMGGSTAGNSIQMAQKQIANGMQNLHSKAKEFAKVGLIDPKNLDYLKTGEVKGTKAGVKHAVKGDELAATDLDRWVYEIMLPALEANNIKSEADKKAWIQKSFGGTGADVITKLMTQRESFEAHARMYNNATGLDGQKLNASDPTAALGALTKSLETFSGVLTSPIMVNAAHGLDYIAGKVGEFSTSLDAFNKAHPNIAKAEAPAAIATGLVGAGGASALAYKLVTSGFGLKGSAVALDAAAAALTEAAVLQGAKGGAGMLPEVAKKAGGTSVLAGALGLGLPLAGAGAVAYVLSEYGDAAKSVNGTGGRPDDALRMNPGDELPGVSGSTDKPSWVVPNAPSMTLAPGAMPLTIQGSGIGGFGLSGPVAPGQAGKEAGEKVGQGVADGIQAKAPAAIEQGESLFRRIKELFAQGVLMPINFAPGEGMGGGGGGGTDGGGGLIHKASFGGGSGGLDGLVRPSNLGSGNAASGFGGVGTRRSGGGTGSLGGDLSGGRVRGTDDASMVSRAKESWDFWKTKGLTDEAAAGLLGMEQGENNFKAHGTGDRGAAWGSFMWRSIRRRQIKEGMGLNVVGANHQQQLEAAFWEMTKGPDVQARQAWRMLQRPGTPGSHAATGVDYFERPLDRALNKRVRGGYANAWHRRFGGQGPTARPLVPADEPRLVKGIDGKDRLDLGNGTMRMPTGEIRSIPRSSDLTIPQPPAGGFGGGGRGGDHARWEAVADRMHGAAERFENASFHGQVDIRTHGPAHVSGLRVKSSGGLSADLGRSQPFGDDGHPIFSRSLG